VIRGSELGKDLQNFTQVMSDADRKRLFNLRDQDLQSQP
jgi:hypothetical protein